MCLGEYTLWIMILPFIVAKVKELLLFFQQLTRVMAWPSLPFPETGKVPGGRNGNGRMVVFALLRACYEWQRIVSLSGVVSSPDYPV